jgi:hypothetical protein
MRGEASPPHGEPSPWHGGARLAPIYLRRVDVRQIGTIQP